MMMISPHPLPPSLTKIIVRNPSNDCFGIFQVIDCLAATVVLSFWTPWGSHGIPTKPLILTHAGGAVEGASGGFCYSATERGKLIFESISGCDTTVQSNEFEAGKSYKIMCVLKQEQIIKLHDSTSFNFLILYQGEVEALIFKLHRSDYISKLWKGNLLHVAEPLNCCSFISCQDSIWCVTVSPRRSTLL